jgi:hypothetical protein
LGVGAPISIPVDNGMVIVVNPQSTGGSLQFSYQVEGSKYPWYDYIFLGQPEWVYYFGLVSITIAAFVIFSLPVALSLAFILILLVVAFGLSITLAAAIAVFAVLVGLVAFLLPSWPLYCCCYFLCFRKKSNSSTKPLAPHKKE